MLNLNQQERNIMIFLITVFLSGTGINLLVRLYSPTKTISYYSRDIGKIDLNSADLDSLITVPGVGEKLAQRILDYRETRGKFSSLEELKDIKGLSGSRLEKIKEHFFLR